MHMSFFENLPFALITALAWGFIAFLVGRKVKRHATIDVFWGAGFLVVYLESLLAAHHLHLHNNFRYVVLALVALWSLRLSIHLGIRQIGSQEDTRYVAIMKGARGRHETLYALKMIYGLQGLLLWFVSIILQYIAYSHSQVLVVAVIGGVIVLIGVFFEGVGDEQLRRFIANPANRGKTMNRGLWRYTRHPNYFGDATVWTGFFICACASGWGALCVLSWATMVWLLTRLSGVPMLEKKLGKTREGYAEYIASTSSFFPRPPKKLS
jgi:steroid 5-alpha reductase family enzyme